MQQRKNLPPILTLLTFAKEHAFIRNIFDNDQLGSSDNIKTFEKYHESFRLFLQIVLLLNSRYSKESNVEDISDDCIVQFVEENCFDNFEGLFSELDKTEIKNIGW